MGFNPVIGVGHVDVAEHVDAGTAKMTDAAADAAADVALAAREQMAMAQGSEEQRVIIEAVQVQRKAVRRSHKKAARMKKDAESMHKAIRRRRLSRLDRHAKKQGWSMAGAPPEAARDARLRGWWQEWRQLKKMGLELR